MSSDGKPLPVPDAVSEPFWTGLRAGALRLQLCRACGRHQFYPRTGCMHCASPDLDWTDASGRGTVHTFTVIHRTGVPGFRDEVPYVVALVDLDEGPRMQTNIVDCEPGEVTVGAGVHLVPRAVSDEVTLPLFALDD